MSPAAPRRDDPLYEPFQDLPSRRDYPTYFTVVKSPMCFAMMERRARKGAYDSLDDLQADFQQMADNAHLFNEKDSFVCQFADRLVVRPASSPRAACRPVTLAARCRPRKRCPTLSTSRNALPSQLQPRAPAHLTTVFACSPGVCAVRPRGCRHSSRRGGRRWTHGEWPRRACPPSTH